jgi:hypothetical protein
VLQNMFIVVYKRKVEIEKESDKGKETQRRGSA